MANLNELMTNIANAIRTKKGTIETINAQNFPSEIENLPSGGGTSGSMKDYIDVKKSCSGMFNGFSSSDFNDEKLSNILKYDDTTNATSFLSMFKYCSYITTIPKLNTSKVTNCMEMCYSCSKLVNFPDYDFNLVTTIESAFCMCGLKKIKLNVSNKLKYSSKAFYQCYSLEKIDIGFLPDTYNTNFAYCCYSLKTLIIRTMPVVPILKDNAFTNCYHFHGTTNSIYNPTGVQDGEIYVPDDRVEEIKVATNWSVFADIIKPLSELVEE